MDFRSYIRQFLVAILMLFRPSGPCCLGVAEAPFLTFRVISESNVRQLGPLSAGPVRPSGPCCLGVAEAPFLSLESSKTATFLVGSESNVRPLGPLPAGPVRPLGPCCLGVAEAPFLSLETHFSHPGAVF